MTGATLISADNTWALMAITCGWVAFTIYAEQTYQWAAKLSGAVVALLGALLLTNLKIIPTKAPWFDDVIWGYVVPLAIPLLLLQCDIRKIWKESGKLLFIFLIGSVATATSAILAFTLLQNRVPEAAGVAAMLTGSYIGGSMNLAALAGSFDVSGEVISAVVVADNLLMACYFFVLIAIPGIGFFRRKFPHPHIDAVEQIGVDEAAKTQAAAYWERKPISLKDIALNLALSTAIVWVSTIISGLLGRIIPVGSIPLSMLNGLLSNRYLIMTTIAMTVATWGSSYIQKTSGTQEIGTYLVYLFLFAIGVPASIGEILKNAPLLFVFCLIMVCINMLACFVFGKLFRFNLEEIILATNANIGGPTTAAAMAISKGWVHLVGPIMLVGTLGYVIGTYCGTIIGQLLGA